MANEVINETEETVQPETSVSEQTTNDSVETPAEETSAATTTQEQEASVTNEFVEASADTPATTEEQTASVADESVESLKEEIPSTAKTEEQTASAQPSAATETQTSSEEDFGSILEKFEQEQTIYHNGDLVEGKVVGVSERGVLIDFGYKSEGIAPIEDFTSPTGEVIVQKGDHVEVTIKSISSGDAPPMLSRADAVSRKSWEVIEKAFNEETPITGRVIDVTKGGLRVDLNGIEAFLPGSQVDSRPIRNLNSFVGQDIETKIIKFSRKRNNIVLSRKVLTDEVVNKQKSETLGNIEEGYVIEGTVKNLTEYGAFVDIGGIDGLLHVTDMSWGRLQNPGDQFKVNDHVQVKVLKLDRQKEKVALGYKQLIPDPWSTVMELYPINEKVKGRVSSVTDYGAFIELEPGVEGLVHVSEMSWSKRSQSPKKLVRSGDEVEVQVLGVDTDDRRISLGMKQLQPNPWQTVHERYQVGQTVRGRVRNLTDFGAFVEIEDGIDGLVHVSDITWSKKVKHPKDVLKRDQEVEAVVKSIDTENRRMSLSIKELTPSAWEAFVTAHKPGDVVRGKISRFTGFGVFVELGNDLEGLCHISELSDERVERPEDIGTIGQEMDFKILRIEHDVQKIGLSARAVGKEEEPVIDTKNYSTEAKSGMASLGELMNLKRGAGAEEETRDEPRQSKKERKAQQAKERAEQEAAADIKAELNEDTETAEPSSDEDSNVDATAETNATGDEQSAENQESEIGFDEETLLTEMKPANEPVADQAENQANAEQQTDDGNLLGIGNTAEDKVENSEAEASESVTAADAGETVEKKTDENENKSAIESQDTIAETTAEVAEDNQDTSETLQTLTETSEAETTATDPTEVNRESEVKGETETVTDESTETTDAHDEAQPVSARNPMIESSTAGDFPQTDAATDETESGMTESGENSDTENTQSSIESEEKTANG
jgi:small subunit ribosomal protein S1